MVYVNSTPLQFTRFRDSVWIQKRPFPLHTLFRDITMFVYDEDGATYGGVGPATSGSAE
jgi:hypothetical protein